MDRGAWWAAVHGSRRVGHNWATSLSLFTFMHWRRKWQPTPLFLAGESQGRGSLVSCRLWGHTESAWLKRLSSSSSSNSVLGFPGGAVVKNPPAGDAGRHGFDPWIRKISWNKKWQPAPVSLPEKFHQQRNLVWAIVHGVEKSQTSLSD